MTRGRRRPSELSRPGPAVIPRWTGAIASALVFRVAGFWLAYASIFLGLGLVLGLVPPQLRMLAAGILVTVASLALTRAFTRWERLHLEDVGASWKRHSIPRFVVGLVFGFAMVLLLVAFTRMLTGPLRLVPVSTGGPAIVLLMAVTFVALSAGEELGFRGYSFFRLRARYGTFVSQLVVALAFAVYHMLLGWPLVNAIVGTTAGSVLFGLAALVSGGLAFPIGVHAAWNIGSWMLGMKDEPGYLRMELGRQPSYVEGAAAYLAVMVMASLALWLWMRWRARVAPPLARV